MPNLVVHETAPGAKGLSRIVARSGGQQASRRLWRWAGRLATSVAIAITFLSCAAEPVTAGVIDVPFNGGLTGFGTFGIDAYRGQTFTALPGLAKELTFYLFTTATNPPLDFVLLLTQVSMTGGIRPTNILFESGKLEFLSVINETVPFTVDLGGIPLVPGEKYAWILDSFKFFDGILASAGVGIDRFGSYTGGELISLNLGPFPSGTRVDHFSSPWFVSPSPLDLAFTFTFTEVPESSTLLLLSFGLAALGACARRRHRRNESVLWNIRIPAVPLRTTPCDPRVLLHERHW